MASRRWRVLSIVPVGMGALLLTIGSLTPQAGGEGLALGIGLLLLGGGVWLASQLAAREDQG